MKIFRSIYRSTVQQITAILLVVSMLVFGVGLFHPAKAHAFASVTLHDLEEMYDAHIGHQNAICVYFSPNCWLNEGGGSYQVAGSIATYFIESYMGNFPEWKMDYCTTRWYPVNMYNTPVVLAWDDELQNLIWLYDPYHEYYDACLSIPFVPYNWGEVPPGYFLKDIYFGIGE